MAIAQILLPILGGVRDATASPGMVWVGAIPFLVHDDTTTEFSVWTFRMPSNYASGLKVYVQFKMASATTGNIRIRVEVMAASIGDPIGSLSYDTLNASADVAVPGSAGNMGEASITLSTVDSVAAGDMVALRIGRQISGVTSNASGDMGFVTVTAEYTAA